MNTARIARVLEVVGDFVPSVHEVVLLVPAFFGLYSAARALGIGVDAEPEVLAGISVTFGCFVWVILNTLACSGAGRPAGAPQEVHRGRDATSVSHRPRPLQVSQAIEPSSEVQPKEELGSVHVGSCHSESLHQGKPSTPAGIP